MEVANRPIQLPAVFAESAGSSYITNSGQLPVPSQQAIKNGAASFTDGFPPNCFIPYASGGAGPFGADFNALFFQVTGGLQWLQAGGPNVYNSTFSSAIGGYPNGAIVASSASAGLYWRSTADNNTTNPDGSSPSNWAVLTLAMLPGATTFYVNSSTGSDVTGNGSIGAPWATPAHAYSSIQETYSPGPYLVTINCTGTFAGFTLSDVIVCFPGALYNVLLDGNGTAAITATGGNPCIYAANGASVGVRGFTLSSSGSGGAGAHGLYAGPESVITVIGSNMSFGVCAGSHLYAAQDGKILIQSSAYAITAGTSGFHKFATGTGKIIGSSTAVTLSGSPTFTSFVEAIYNGYIEEDAVSTPYSGSAGSGTARANASYGGGINTFGVGQSYFPGTTNGTISSPGWLD